MKLRRRKRRKDKTDIKKKLWYDEPKKNYPTKEEPNKDKLRNEETKEQRRNQENEKLRKE